MTTGGVAHCWGWNLYGEVGDGTTTQRLTPVAVAGGLPFSFTVASLASFHTCGVTTGSVAYCWGYNYYGQLGDGTTTDRSTPVPVAGPM